MKFSLNNTQYDVELGTQITRDQLYGKSKVIAVSHDGKELKKARLTQTGEIINATQIARLTVDSTGSYLGDEVYTLNGEVVTPTPSSSIEVRELQLLPLTSLTDLHATVIYPITNITGLPEGLYKTTYNLRASVHVRTAYLMINSQSYLILGDEVKNLFIGKDESFQLFDEQQEEEEEGGDFDFTF